MSKLSQQASQGHINGFLWASKLAVCQPLNPGKPSKPLKRLKPFKTLKPLPKRLGPDPYPLLFLTVQFAVHQAFAANRQPQATSMASYGRPSLLFASPQTPKTLQTPKTPKTLQTPKTPKTLKALKISKPLNP